MATMYLFRDACELQYYMYLYKLILKLENAFCKATYLKKSTPFEYTVLQLVK